MNTRTKLLLTAAAVLTVGTLALSGPVLARGGGDCDGWGRHEAGGHGHHHEGGFRGKGMHLFERFDADGDGAITQEEIDKAQTERFQSADKDGNGTVDLEEYQAYWAKQMRPRMVDRFQTHDDDGDGKVTQEEFSGRASRMSAWMDRNDDGVINREDFRH